MVLSFLYRAFCRVNVPETCLPRSRDAPALKKEPAQEVAPPDGGLARRDRDAEAIVPTGSALDRYSAVEIALDDSPIFEVLYIPFEDLSESAEVLDRQLLNRGAYGVRCRGMFHQVSEDGNALTLLREEPRLLISDGAATDLLPLLRCE